MSIAQLRKQYHQAICQDILRIKESHTGSRYPNIADGSNRSSVQISWRIFEQLNCDENVQALSGQRAGGRFEVATRDFLAQAFALLTHVRPGNWVYRTTQTGIAQFDQYAHLAYIEGAVQSDYNLAATLGSDYIITPDIIIARLPITDAEINLQQEVVPSEDAHFAAFTPLRQMNSQGSGEILHASISCKWTIRSDRSQNTRTEALNLIRNRKGHLPHIVAVTAEPLPTRLAALALGTGDLDCVYHFALPELQQALEDADNQDQLEMLEMMVNGRRLRDISDLPFDLAI